MKKIKTYRIIEKRKNNREYAYDVSYQYDPLTQKSIYVKGSKKYIGVVLGYTNNNQAIVEKTRSMTKEQILSGIQHTNNTAAIDTFNGKELFKNQIIESTDSNTKLKSLSGNYAGYYLDKELTALYDTSNTGSLYFVQKNIEKCYGDIKHTDDIIHGKQLKIKSMISVYPYSSKVDKTLKKLWQQDREFITVYDTKSPPQTGSLQRIKEHIGTTVFQIPNSPYEILSTVRDKDDSYIKKWGEMLVNLQHFKTLYDELFPDGYNKLTAFYTTLKTFLNGSSLSLKQLIEKYKNRLEEINNLREITYPDGRKETVKVVDPGVVDEQFNQLVAQNKKANVKVSSEVDTNKIIDTVNE